MTGKIFRSIMIASVATMFTAIIIIAGMLYEYFGGIQKNNLKAEYSLAAAAVETGGTEYLQTVKNHSCRLTWVAADGTVLYDTSADASLMENHSDREEIKEAFASGTGESERYSATLTEKTLYYAGLLSDGTILRISSSHASILALVLGMVQPILIVLVIMIIISVFLASRMAKRIVEPFNSLDLENPLDNKAYEELSPMLRRINALQNDVRYQLRKLKRKTDEFEQITGSMNEGLVVLDKRGTIVSINASAALFFATEKSCVGDDFLTVDRSIEIQNAINKALNDGHSEIRLERNGGEYQLDISGIDSAENGIENAADNAVQSAIGVVILIFDVTEKVFAERNRREFTANVSHELKTPLQSIMGSAELIENGLVKPEDMPRFVGHIRSEAERLVSLIEDIIRLSQLDENNEMQREDTDLYAVASEVKNELQYAAEAKNITLCVSGESVVIDGVKKLLTEIIFNLCDNALKYTDKGGHVSVDISKRDNNAILTVSDDGIGIPPEHQSRIFERFYRVDKSHSKASGGTGLGLSIVKHAVQYHHGKIYVESKSGKGSVFTVTFPLDGK